MGALDGITIVDFTRYQQGAWGTAMLADMGAEVVKLEQRIVGDLGRAMGLQPDGFCAYFEAHNRGKKSITLDFRRPEAKEIVRKLVERLDVVAHNFRPGVMERLGFGYDDFVPIDPTIIFATASGFGPRGPWADRPSYDVIGQGVGGLAVAQAGGPENDPVTVTAGLADQVGAMMLAFGIVNALVARERQGIGQKVDTSLYGAQLSLQALSVTGAMRNGMPPRRTANAGFNATFRPYKCGDGKWLTIGVIDPDHYVRLCKAVDRLDLTYNVQFSETFARYDNAGAMVEELGKEFAKHSRDEWLKILMEHDVPCGPVQSYVEIGDDPQARENGYIRTLEHPTLGSLKVVGPPVELSATPGSVGVAPQLGEHTDEILCSLGYTDEQIAALRASEII